MRDRIAVRVRALCERAGLARPPIDPADEVALRALLRRAYTPHETAAPGGHPGTAERDAQRTAALALADLLTEPLPVLTWTVHEPYAGRPTGRLYGTTDTADADLAGLAVAYWRAALIRPGSAGSVIVRHHDDNPVVAETVTLISGAHQGIPVSATVRLYRAAQDTGQDGDAS